MQPPDHGQNPINEDPGSKRPWVSVPAESMRLIVDAVTTGTGLTHANEQAVGHLSVQVFADQIESGETGPTVDDQDETDPAAFAGHPEEIVWHEGKAYLRDFKSGPWPERST